MTHKWYIGKAINKKNYGASDQKTWSKMLPWGGAIARHEVCDY